MKQWLSMIFLLVAFPASGTALTLQGQTSLAIDHSGLRCWPRGEFVQIEALSDTYAVAFGLLLHRNACTRRELDDLV